MADLKDEDMAARSRGRVWLTFLIGIVVVAVLAIGAVAYLGAPPAPRLDIAIRAPNTGVAPQPSPSPLPSPLPRPPA